MNIHTQRVLDACVGRPCCSALTLWRRCFGDPPRDGPVRRVALAKFLGLGSILQALPVVRTLKRLHPGVHITFLTFSPNRPLFDLIPEVDEVVAFDTSGLRPFGVTVARHLGALRRAGLDLLLDLEFFSRFSAMIAYLSAARERVGYFLPEVPRGDLLTRRVFYSPYRHISQIFLSLVDVDLARSPVDPALFRVDVPPAARRSADAALRLAGIDPEKPFVAVNPNAGDMCLERRWDAPKFRELAARIRETLKTPVVMIGAPSDRSYVESIGADAVNLAGGVDVPALAGVLLRARVLVTNDSGPLHLAAAVGTPTISFFGPETPAIYGPSGPGHLVFFTGVHCSPCLTVHNQKIPPCGGRNICLQSLGVDEVWERSRPLLEDRVR